MRKFESGSSDNHINDKIVFWAKDGEIFYQSTNLKGEAEGKVFSLSKTKKKGVLWVVNGIIGWRSTTFAAGEDYKKTFDNFCYKCDDYYGNYDNEGRAQPLHFGVNNPTDEEWEVLMEICFRERNNRVAPRLGEKGWYQIASEPEAICGTIDGFGEDRYKKIYYTIGGVEIKDLDKKFDKEKLPKDKSSADLVMCYPDLYPHKYKLRTDPDYKQTGLVGIKVKYRDSENGVVGEDEITGVRSDPYQKDEEIAETFFKELSEMVGREIKFIALA